MFYRRMRVHGFNNVFAAWPAITRLSSKERTCMMLAARLMFSIMTIESRCSLLRPQFKNESPINKAMELDEPCAGDFRCCQSCYRVVHLPSNYARALSVGSVANGGFFIAISARIIIISQIVLRVSSNFARAPSLTAVRFLTSIFSYNKVKDFEIIRIRLLGLFFTILFINFFFLRRRRFIKLSKTNVRELMDEFKS